MGELRKRGRIWWFRYYRNGRRFEESSHSEHKGDASRLMKQREGDIAKGVPINAAIGRLRFEDAAAAVAQDYAMNGRDTTKDVTRRIRMHLQPFFGGRRMSAISTAEITAYVVTRQAAGAANASVNRELSIMKRAFTLAVQAGKLVTRPHVPMLEERNTRRGFFEPEQFAAVCGHLPAALRPVAAFAYLTGWRVRSEVLPLEWRSVDWRAREVRLDAGATKNDEGRSYPLTAALEVLLKAQLADHDARKKAGTIVPFVFHRNGRKIKNFRHAWETAREKAGVPGRLLHDFRRTAVRNLELSGVPRAAAMHMVGHKTESIYRRYAIVDATSLRDAAARIDAAAGTISGTIGAGSQAPPAKQSA
ncbi:MAG TPA: tyrosine-type recombinase/integrase [Gemmatimonadaceae bacterium]|nr:tyrosine-type recombinase/integrase [Gemmatimonadaceae bacterium]